MTTKLPHSTVKRLLVGDSGLRANGEAVGAFSEKILAFAKVESEKISKIVESKRRKTIYKEDILAEVADEESTSEDSLDSDSSEEDEESTSEDSSDNSEEDEEAESESDEKSP